jgi:hypothetical protein
MVRGCFAAWSGRGHLALEQASTGGSMRCKSLVLVTILFAATAYAKEPKAYQSGKVLQMDSAQCGVAEKDGKSLAAEICQEYVLQTERVIYRIRPWDTKHPALLPVGGDAEFRIEKDKMLLRVGDLDGKEREYTVISMTPRGESTAEASPARLNHLQ